MSRRRILIVLAALCLSGGVITLVVFRVFLGPEPPEASCASVMLLVEAGEEAVRTAAALAEEPRHRDGEAREQFALAAEYQEWASERLDRSKDCSDAQERLRQLESAVDRLDDELGWER